MVYTIAINIASLTYVHVTDWPTKRVYMTGDVFDFAGSQFWGIYSDGEWRLETGGYTPRGFDSSAPGELRVGIEKHGIPAKMYRTTSTSGTLHPGLTKIDFDVVYSYGENFLITVLPSTAKALFFWHGLTADYKPQPKRYTVPAGRTLTLAPAKWYIPDNAVYEWRVDGVIRSGHTTEYFPYTAAASSGEHTIRVAAKVDGIEIAADETTVVCTPAAVPRSKNSASSVTAEKLYSVVAPGQFGSGSERLGELHGFGGFGGYGVFKFDHSVMKQPGGEEMSIGGNAFALWQEPGVIWVSQDDNGNGEPDDTWYELQGSHTFAPTTTRRYVVKYRPDIWINNLGEGDRTHNWQEAETPPGLTEMTLVGTNIRDPGSGIVMWGYADVVDNGRVSLSNAILEDGTPVDLPFIDFVKIVSGQHLYTDMFGEKSTEARTPTDRSMGDLDSHITYDTKVDGGYKYTFTNNSGYDLTIEILEGGETFTLVSGASVVKIIDKTGIYIEYWGGNVKLKKSPGHGSFYDQD
jgi:hypothetical protein